MTKNNKIFKILLSILGVITYTGMLYIIKGISGVLIGIFIGLSIFLSFIVIKYIIEQYKERTKMTRKIINLIASYLDSKGYDTDVMVHYNDRDVIIVNNDETDSCIKITVEEMY